MRLADNVAAAIVAENLAQLVADRTRDVLPGAFGIMGDGDYRCRNIVGQPHSSIDLRRMMDRGQVLIANLSTGALGAGISHLLGALLSAALTSAAFSRADIPEQQRRPFALYVDEFQLFANDAFAEILSGARKFGLLLTLAQSIS